jgi:uncharacterized protein (TIGR02001 family)
VCALANVRCHASGSRPRSDRYVAFRGSVILLLSLIANAADAQVSGTLAAVSDYRYRGITLSDRKPAAQISATYDDPIGWYAGAFGSTVRLAPPADANFQAMTFGGYALRLPSGVSVEAGGDYSLFTNAHGDDYGELFIGAAAENFSARVYYSPRYFGQSSNAVYGEVNTSLPLFDRLQLIAHVGVLKSAYPYGYRQQSTRNFVDGRIGLVADFELFHLEIAWVGISSRYAAFPITGTSSPNAAVVSLSHSF